MRRSAIYAALFLGSAAYPQTSPAPSIRITAIRADMPQQPVVPEVLISLLHTRTKASYGRRTTDRNGVVLLDLPGNLGEAAYLQVMAEGKELAVYQPIAGSLPASALFATGSLTVALVPKRSALLQTPPQIQARLNEEERILRENREVRLQNASLQAGLASLKAEQDREREEYRRHWSEATGFTVEELANVVTAFARAILENPGAHSADERALALYAQGKSGEAGELLRKDELSATDKRTRELQALRDRVTQELEKAERSSAEETIQRLSRAAGLFAQAFDFQQAADTWADCIARIDPKLADLRAKALVEQGNALQELGGKGGGDGSPTAFRNAVAAYRSALEVYTRTTLPRAWAMTQNNLGNALTGQSGSTSGQAADLLTQAVAAYHSALEVSTREAFPMDWATTQNNLGIALHDRSGRTSGQAGVDLLAQAITALRSALEVRTRDTLPQEWIATQNNLGTALRDQAIATSGQAGVDLLAQAVAAFRGALEMHMRAALPQDWAMTQNNLGIALRDQAGRISGKAAVDLLAEAVAAFRSALEVYTRTALPQNWAATQNNLGIALSDQAAHTTGQASVDLLAQAVAAYRSALEVHTRAALPQNWAMTQNNLGEALYDQAKRTTGPAGEELLAQAVAAFRSALEVYTRDTLPQGWAANQTNLGNALSNQARRTTGQARVDLLAQAVAAFRSALQVYTRDTLPQGWAANQTNLGMALRDQAELTSGQAAVDLLAQAVAAYRSALEVRTRDTLPQDWAMTQNNLAVALHDQAMLTSGQAGVDLLVRAVAIYHSALEVRTRDTLPQQWAATQNSLGIALSDQAGRTSGQAAVDLLAQAVAAYRSALEVYTRTALPQNWAATQNRLAEALIATGDWLGAAKAMESFLELYPAMEDALSRLAGIYEDHLFDYGKALPILQKLYAMNKTVGDVENVAESLLQNGRFADCDKTWGTLTNENLPPNRLPLRDTFRLACQSAAGNSTAALATAAGLVSVTLAPTRWGLNGTLHYLSTSAAFADHRDVWVGLFTALDKADTSAFRTALREIEASLNSR